MYTLLHFCCGGWGGAPRDSSWAKESKRKWAHGFFQILPVFPSWSGCISCYTEIHYAEINLSHVYNYTPHPMSPLSESMAAGVVLETVGIATFWRQFSSTGFNLKSSTALMCFIIQKVVERLGISLLFWQDKQNAKYICNLWFQYISL